MDELHYLSATEALERFSARTLSPVELMAAVIERAEATEPEINALTARYWEEAADAARAAETRFAGNGPSPRALEGLPVAIKELTPIRGKQHTLGSLALKDNVAEETAPIAERIMAAGGIVHARTTTPEFGCASFTHSRLYGITRNPWNLDCAPAGSSGGAASALAVGSTTLAQGSDSAGSLRLPASACGVVGYKPPHGRVPGILPLSLETCNHDGPMARTVDDCALLENVIAGPHPADPTSIRPKLSLSMKSEPIDGWRIALAVGMGGIDVDDEVEASTREAAAALREAGAKVEEVEIGWEFERVMEATKLHYAATYGPMVERVVSAAPDLATPYAAAFVKEERRFSDPTDFVLRSNELKAELWEPLSRLFRRHRLLLCPTLAFPAPEAGKDYIDEGPVVNGVEQQDRWIVATTVPFNLLNGCPAISLPSGLASNGVPTGAQLIGRPFDDRSVFRAARVLESTRPRLGAPEFRPRMPNNKEGV